MNASDYVFEIIDHARTLDRRSGRNRFIFPLRNIPLPLPPKGMAEGSIWPALKAMGYRIIRRGDGVVLAW